MSQSSLASEGPDNWSQESTSWFWAFGGGDLDWMLLANAAAWLEICHAG